MANYDRIQLFNIKQSETMIVANGKKRTLRDRIIIVFLVSITIGSLGFTTKKVMDIQSDKDKLSWQNEQGLIVILKSYIRTNNLESFRKTIQENPHIVNYQQEDGRTLLHITASMVDRARFSAILLSKEADVNAVDKHSRKPFHCYLGLGDVIPLLVNRGVELDVFAMAGHGMLKELKEVIERKPSLLNAVDPVGRSLLDHAAEVEQFAVVQWLLDKGCVINMYWAARLGRSDELAELLKVDKYLERYSFPQVQPLPLIGAIRSGNPEIVELVLQAGASVDGQGEDINQPIRLAIKNKNDAVARVLLDYGACPILHFRVVDLISGEIINRAKIKIRQGGILKRNSTDAQGYKQIEVNGKETDGLWIHCEADGYVPTEISWKKQKGIWPVPLRFEMTLEASVAVGGVVKNSDGKPVKNAKVYLQLPSMNGGLQRQRLAISHRSVTTDKKGKWQCDYLPADIDGIKVQVVHPDYRSDEIFGKGVGVFAGSLRDGTCKLVLQRGIDVVGIVMDQNQKPIANAWVSKVQGSNGHFPAVRTDRQGRFVLPPVRAGQIILDVWTGDGLKCTQQVVIKDDMIPLELYVSSQVAAVD